MNESLTDISDLAPVVDSHEPEFLDLGGVAIHGTRAERRALFAALAKAQGTYRPIERSRTVTVRSDKGNYTFDYAPLENVLEATMPSLNGNGLALLNAVSDAKEGKDLHTMLTHEDGAVIHMTMRMPSVTKPQDLGSQITYARRYSIQCVTGTSPEFDDDGNEGSGNRVDAMKDKRPQARQDRDRAAQPAPKFEPSPEAARQQAARQSEPPPPASRPLAKDDPQSAVLAEAFSKLGWAKPAVAKFCKESVGAFPQDMTVEQADRLIAILQNQPEAS